MIKAIKTAIKDFSDDECMVSGAALAYYTIFSLPPLLVLVFYVAGLFGVSQQTINDVVSEQLGIPTSGLASQEGGQEGAPSGGSGGQSQSGQQQGGNAGSQSGGLAGVAESQSSQANPVQALGPVSKVIGILLLIFSATGVFAQLQHALNRAWEVEPDPEAGGVKSFLAKRGLSLGMIVVVAFLLLVSLVLTTLVDEIIQSIQGQSPGAVGQTLGILANVVITLVLATALFAAVYKVLPDAEMRWKDIWVGAFITAVLFVIGKTLIGWYLQNSNVGSSWGSAAASMVAVLVWVYYTSLIVLLGAELTQAWVSHYGAGIKPAEGAVRIVEEKRHIRGAREPRPSP